MVNVSILFTPLSVVKVPELEEALATFRNAYTTTDCNLHFCAELEYVSVLVLPVINFRYTHMFELLPTGVVR